MLSDLDEPVHLRCPQPERPDLWRRPGAGSNNSTADRCLQGDGRLRFCRAVSGAARRLKRYLRARAALLAASALIVFGAPAHAAAPPTATPIEHLIVVVGENLSFDNLFGIYEPKSGSAVHNLLSEGIINRDGSPGPNFANAAQRKAEVHELYEVTPHIVGTYGLLPQPGTTHAVGLPRNVPDQRFPELLANGPFQITKYVGYADPVGDPVHRFFQMWQQVDGGRRDLFVWVAETSGEGSLNRADPASGTNQGG